MANKNFDIIVIGELNIDLVLWQVPMPEDGKEKLASDMRFAMGSSSAITAHNAAVLGSRVAFVGKSGADTFGHFMAEELSVAGVDTSHILMDAGLKTGATIVLANPPKKALLTYMGAMQHLTLEDMDWEFIRTARHLHLGCFFLQTGIRADVWKLFAKAKEMGLTTSLDTNWDPDEQWDNGLLQALPFIDIFFPNDDEALRIARTQDLQTAMEILGKQVKILVVKKGAAGAMVWVNNEVIAAPPYAVPVVETTGAGDSFNAGFLHHFVLGMPLQDCLAYGNACGALAVTAMGGTGAYRDRSVVSSKLQQIIHGK